LRKYHIVYQTTNTINGKIYIGCHSTDVIEDGYIGSSLLLKQAVAMHGTHNVCIVKLIKIVIKLQRKASIANTMCAYWHDSCCFQVGS
jgi:hypothetical protein